MSPLVLGFLRGVLPLLKLAASKTATTADDTIVAFLEALLNAPAPQAAAMLKAAHAQVEHMAATAAAATSAAEVTDVAEKTGKKK